VIAKSEQLSLFEQEQRALPKLSDEQVMRRLCESLLEEAEVVEPPVPVKMLASLRGIASIEEAEQPFSGLLRPGEQGFEVRVRRGDGYERQRFTICHEAGHTLLPGFREARQFRCNGPRNWLEKMCDVAGAELLLPKYLIDPRLTGSRLDLKTVQQLSDQFEASIEATARRAVALADRPAMLIVLSERHKPIEAGRESELPAKLRVDYSVTQGKWPFVLRHKSAGNDGLARTLQGEIVDECGSIDELCAQSLGEVRINAKRFGREGRVLALIERVN
jgi:uncharacterized protein DUF955